MNEQVVRIRAIDPLLFRDGRPFGADIGSLLAQTLPLPYPSTLAGFVRTFAGNRWGVDWADEASVQRVLNIHVRGPLLMRNDKHVFRAPADAVVWEQGEKKQVGLTSLRPQPVQPGEGSNLPPGILPLLPQKYIEGKPSEGYDLWTWDTLSQWLADPTGDATSSPEKIGWLEVEERVHVAIEDDKGTSKEELLFTVQFLSFERYRWKQQASREEWCLLVHVRCEESLSLQGVGLLGGEKRLASVEPVDAGQWLTCPSSLQDSLRAAKRVRLFLATPAVFRDGWKPGWLDENLIGSPPFAPNLKLQLVSAAVRRHEAVSGWDYREDHRCPKAVRWLAPAGSVYFFQVLEGEPELLATEAWLQSVCDDLQDQRDGYGLALWGIW